MLNLREIASVNELAALEGEWSELAARSSTATPFQHPGWVLPWYEHFGSGELFVLTVRADGRLIALFPLFLHEWAGKRQLTILGTGVSDYLGILSESGSTREAVAAVVDHIAQTSARWDVCSWQDLSSDSPLLSALPEELAPTITDAQPCVSLPLPGTWDAFRESLPHGLQRNIRRYTERLSSTGELRFETLCEDADGSAMAELFSLHAKRWHEIGEEGVLHDANIQAVHRAAARRLASAGALRLYRMTLDGRAIGVIYGYGWRGTYYSYLGGFEPALKACSPGTVLLAYAMQQAIEEGMRTWDFLRGEEAYKFTWGGVAAPKRNILLYANGA